MRSYFIFTFLILQYSNLIAQENYLSLEQQREDFRVFRQSLKEGHAGLYYYIDKNCLEKKLDSVANTFRENLSREDYYLKLAFSISLLDHGHSRIKLKEEKYSDFRMAVLNKTKLYLPFRLIISNGKVFINADLSGYKRDLFGKEILSINEIKIDSLLTVMSDYIPADGGSIAFKNYYLFKYYYFHYLFNLFWPDQKMFTLEIKGLSKPVTITAKTPEQIDSAFTKKYHESISMFAEPLGFNSVFSQGTSYLRIGSFYKGFIESYGNEYIPFLDSVFQVIKEGNIENLIIDLRNNEGGGDNYENILLTYLTEQPFIGLNHVVRTPGKKFSNLEHTSYLSDDIVAYINNPHEFLEQGSTMLLKKVYVDMMGESEFYSKENSFEGNLYVLINGGSFSATTQFLRLLYDYRAKQSTREIIFIGSQNGGDLRSNIQCAGQSYIVTLPNSDIEIDMPFLCFGDWAKNEKTAQIPDIAVYQTQGDIVLGVDAVLEFVKQYLD